MDRQTRAASVDTSAWDGPAAMSGCAKMDDPAAAYNAICAGKKAGDPKLQSSHALPHHKAPGDPPNKTGVSNALSRLPQTQGLTNAAAAKSHLESHMKAINPDYEPSKALTPADIRQARSAAGIPGGDRRTRAFASRDLRANLVDRNGKSFYEFHGYATTFNQQYEMWDMFGPYLEGVRNSALNKSLGASPDVAFLVNHKGVTMARTTNDTLTIQKDLHGLAIDAFLNSERQDVRDFASAVADGLVDEMSFAFRLLDGEWEWADETGREYDEFWLTEVDINRGDVSGVNYGANPFTEIAARAADWLADAERMPEPVIREVIKRVARRDDVMNFRSAAIDLAERAEKLYAGAADDLVSHHRPRLTWHDKTADLSDIKDWPVIDETGEDEEGNPLPDTSERAKELRNLDKPIPESGVSILSVANRLHALEEDL